MAPKPFADVRAVAVAAGVGVVALIAGIAIAGLPNSVPNDIVISDVAASAPAASTTSIAEPLRSSTTAAPARTATDEPDRELESSPTTAARPSSTTAAAASTAATPATTTAPGPALAPESAIRVVVANAGGVNGLAARYTDVVSGLGYASVEPANATDRRDVSIVYWSPGREGEARRLAEQLGVAAVEPLPVDRVVLGNFVADVWAMIGLDLQER